MAADDLPGVVAVPAREQEQLAAGAHHEPHRILGAHPAVNGRTEGAVLRAFHPDAQAVWALVGESSYRLHPLGQGLFGTFLPRAPLPLAYRLRFEFSDGARWERDDPYRFLPSVGETDRYLFNEGNHRRLWEFLGAHACTHEGVKGVRFAVWAPAASRVSVVGDFCGWDGRLFPMRVLGSSGVWELFVPGLEPGALYKFEVRTAAGEVSLKTDPLARAMEVPPGTASRVERSRYEWGDETWQLGRAQADPLREPVLIYECHLGSWARVPEENNRPLSYREIAPRLVEHLKRFGFTHLELLPIMEHPFSGSWGYQVSGYYAPTSRHGTPDDFRYLVDTCHQAGIGVILDWVPGHFPRDVWALAHFDGTRLYEHEDPRRGAHPDWGTLVFNYGRHEVRNFLLANALYWMKEFHVDALRVDAVASMLYLDYSRKEGEWIPNALGGREDLDAISFLKHMNEVVREECPGCFTVAEESTAWAGVSRPVREGGLGFTFKWNMGWMHDTLSYFARDPVHRRWHQDQLTFAMLYEHTERFIMPLSHDEVVHGKGALLEKMPGDPWQKLANLRLLLGYMYTRPGKKLLFMGTELASWREWNHDQSLDWHLQMDPERSGVARCMEDLGRLYLQHPALWRLDHEPGGFEWIDCADADNSILSFLRRAGDDLLLVAVNLTPVPRQSYRIGSPRGGAWRRLFDSDDPRYGGSQVESRETAQAEETPWHGRPWSLDLVLPPLAAVVYAPA